MNLVSSLCHLLGNVTLLNTVFLLKPLKMAKCAFFPGQRVANVCLPSFISVLTVCFLIYLYFFAVDLCHF